MDSILAKIATLRITQGERGEELEMDENFPVEILQTFKDLKLPSLTSIRQQLVHRSWNHVRDDLITSLTTAIIPRTDNFQEAVAKHVEYSALTDRLNERVSRLKDLAKRPGNDFLGLHLCKHAITILLAINISEALICGGIYGHLLVHVMQGEGRQNWEILRALGNDDQTRFVCWRDVTFPAGDAEKLVRHLEFGHTNLYYPSPIPEAMITVEIPVTCMTLAEDDSIEITGGKGIRFGAGLRRNMPDVVKAINLTYPFGNPVGKLLDVQREIEFFAERLEHFVTEVHPLFGRFWLSDVARREFFVRARQALLRDD